jgi:hypothetical protein
MTCIAPVRLVALTLPTSMFLLNIACSNTTSVRDVNDPPTADIRVPDADTVVDAGPIVLRGIVADTNSGWEVEATWTFNGVAIEGCQSLVVKDSDEESATTCETSLWESGEVGLEVTDGASATPDSVYVTVNQGDGPTVAWKDLAPGVFYADRQASLAAMVVDPSDALTDLIDNDLVVLLADGEVIDATMSGADGEVSINTRLPEAQALRLVLEARDFNPLRPPATDEITVQVKATNTAPSCPISQPTSGDVYTTGDAIAFAATGEDDDVTSDYLTYSLTQVAQGSSVPLTVDGVSATHIFQDLDSGEYDYVYTVTDEAGGVCQVDIAFVVTDAPEIVLASPDPTKTKRIAEGDKLKVAFTLQDDEDDITVLATSGAATLHEWSSLAAGQEHNVELVDLPYGEHTIVFTATDARGRHGVVSATVEVNDLPSKPELRAEPSEPTTSADVVAVIEKSSKDDYLVDELTYSYVWTSGKSEVLGATLPATDTQRDQVWQLEVTPDDGYDQGKSAALEVVIANSAPTSSSPTITPTENYGDEALRCSAEGLSDADGDGVTPQYQWTRGAEVLGSSSQLSPDAFEPGDAIVCTVTPFDGTDHGSATSTDIVIASNVVPVISQITISPAQPTANDMLTVSVQVQDADGPDEEVEYVWYVDGDVVGFDATLSTVFTKGDVVTVKATPSDGVTTGQAETFDVVIANSIPSIASVSMLPALPTAIDDLTAVPAGWADGDDDDPDYRYRWVLDEVEVAGATSQVLSAAEYVRDQSIRIEVRPDDGEAMGTMQQATVVIANSAPSLGDVELQPGAADTTTALTALPSGFADADTTDGAHYLYLWNVNGGGSVTSATLPASSFEKGDVVSLTVTPLDDRDLAGPAMDQSLTVGNWLPVIDDVVIEPDIISLAGEAPSAVVVNRDERDLLDLNRDLTQWWVNGTMVHTGDVLPLSALAQDVPIVACVTPKDQDGAGIEVCSAERQVDNTAPTLTHITVTENPATTTDLVVVAHGFHDDDNDPKKVRVTFLRGGDVLQTGSELILASDAFNKGDVIDVEVVPYDAWEDGPTYSTSRTIDNTAPRVDEVSLNPATPTTANAITAVVADVLTDLQVDPDGDGVEYRFRWFVDNSPYTSVTGDTFPASKTAKSNVVQVRVKAWDGEEETAEEVIASVIVGNSPPQIDSVSASPATWTTDTQPVVLANKREDPDGKDPNLDLAEWFDADGVRIHQGEKLPSSATVAGESYTACVTPYDGASYGDQVCLAESVTVDNTPPTLALSTSSISITEDGESAPISLYIGDVDVDATALTVSATVDTALIDPIDMFSGYGDTRYAVIRPLANAFTDSAPTLVTFTVSDGVDTVSKTVAVTINGENDPPTIDVVESSVTIDEDGSTAPLLVKVSDIDNDPSELEVVVLGGSHLMDSDGYTWGGTDSERTLVLAGKANVHGSRTLTLQVSDGTATASDSLYMKVNAVNDEPTLSLDADSLVSGEDEWSPWLGYQAADVDGGTWEVGLSVDQAGLLAEWSDDHDRVRLKPTADAFTESAAKATLSVFDGEYTISKSFDWTVTATDDPPVITSSQGSIAMTEGGSAEANFAFADVDTPADQLEVAVSTSDETAIPLSGVVFSEDGTKVTVTPQEDAYGSYTLTFTVSDGNSTVQHDMTVGITGVNDAPWILIDETDFVIEEDESFKLSFSAGDPDLLSKSWGLRLMGDGQVFASTVASEDRSSQEGQDFEFTVQPKPNAFSDGPVELILRADDYDGMRTDVTITVAVNSINDPPTIVDFNADTTVVAEDGTAYVYFKVADPDDDLEGLVVTASSSDETVIDSDGFELTGTTAYRSLRVRPRANANTGTGTIDLTLKVSDEQGVATVSWPLQVKPQDDPPTIVVDGDSFSAQAGTSHTLDALVTDVDGDDVTLSVKSTNNAFVSTSGIAFGGSGENRTVTVTPNPGAVGGPFTIAIQAFDGTSYASDAFLFTFTCVPGSVSVPTQFSTIQQGVDSVCEGGVVQVSAGTYKEDVKLIDGDISLLGVDGPEATTILSTGGTAIAAGGGDVTVDGFTVEGGSGGLDHYRTPDTVTVRNVDFKGQSGYAINLRSDKTKVELDRVTATDIDWTFGAMYLDISELTARDVTVEGCNTQSTGSNGTFQVTTTGDILLERLRLIDNTSVAHSVATIVGSNTSTVTLNDVESIGNSFTKYGAITVWTAEHVEISNLLIQDNVATSGDGGGLVLESGVASARVIDSTIQNNKTSGKGGGVYSEALLTVLEDTVIADNRAALGGGLYFYGPNVEVDLIDVLVDSNDADNGAGIYFSNNIGEVTASNLTVSDNHAGGAWGGLAALQAEPMTIEDSVFLENTAPTGAGAFVSQSGAAFRNVDFIGNVASSETAALVALTSGSNGVLELDGVRFLSNGIGPYGTAVYVIVSGGAEAIVRNVEIIGNRLVDGAEYDGHRAAVFKGVADFSNIVVAGNDGGLLLNGGNGSQTLANATVHGNHGIGIEIYRDPTYAMDIRNTIVADNTVGVDDGRSGTLQWAYNLVAENSTNYSGITDPTGTDGNVSDAATFVDVSSTDPLDWDLHLATGSVGIDDGDPDIDDLDETRSDIGAYGGPNAP